MRRNRSHWVWCDATKTAQHAAAKIRKRLISASEATTCRTLPEPFSAYYRRLRRCRAVPREKAVGCGSYDLVADTELCCSLKSRKTNCTRGQTDRVTFLANCDQPILTYMILTFNLPPQRLWSWPIHTQKSRSKVSWFKSNRRTDTTDRTTFPANTVGKRALPQQRSALLCINCRQLLLSC